VADPFLTETKALLERTPKVLRDLLGGLPDAWLDGRDTPDGWQPRDVVGHLITAEMDDWIPRARMILEYGTTRPFDRFDRHAMLERDKGVALDRCWIGLTSCVPRACVSSMSWWGTPSWNGRGTIRSWVR
jgi:hypothetical protein